MIDVIFLEVNSSDSSDYIFVDKNKNQYHLFNDSRGKDVKNITPDFWDKFFFCKSIKIDYLSNNDSKIISRIISYK